MEDVYGVAAFRSRQQVLQFENALQREGLNVQVVSTPHDISMGCGLSVRFRLQDKDTVVRVLRRMNTSNLIGLYRVEYDGGRLRVSALPLR